MSVKPALGEVLSATVPMTLPTEAQALLAVNRAQSLTDVYARWADAVLGLNAAAATGRFPTSGGDPQAKRATLDRIVALDGQIRKLTAAARRETQVGRRAELNRQLQDARRQRDQAAETL